MSQSYQHSSVALRCLLNQYRSEYADACNVNNVSWQQRAARRIKEISEELPQVELMEKLESNL